MITITRKTRFSSAHYFQLPELSEEENLALFGKVANKHGHGHNYEIEAAISGEVDPQTGMVINLTDIKRVLKEQIVEALDFKNLNHEIPYFQKRLPSLEGLLSYCWERLHGELPGLSWLRISEQDDFHGETNGDPMIYLTRCYGFCASHRLYNPDFSDEDNWKVFGKCNNPNGHGHNYELEVTIKGLPDERTGLIVDLGKWDSAMESVVDQMDHKNLNEDVSFMKGVIPTAENIVKLLWEQVQVPEPALLHKLRLRETANNHAEFMG